MCGIIGCVGREDASTIILDALSRLEYRGYDSAGIALGGGSIDVEKRAGPLERLRDAIDARGEALSGAIGIGHTRWSTHGAPTDANAHPHTSGDNAVAVVHNGVIENYAPLRDRLETEGVEFASETDTEVIPHLVSNALDGSDPEGAIRTVLDRVDGSYALAVLIEGDPAIYGARRDSPLIVGIGDGSTYLASDVPAFLDHTRDVVYLEDGDLAILSPDEVRIQDSEGTTVDRPVERVDWTAEEAGKGGYAHYMLKEIHDQPAALRQCLSGRVDEFSGRVTVDALDTVGTPRSAHLVAAGSSYHAALVGAHLLRTRGITADAYLASEYAIAPPPIDGGLVIGVTQSGETADTLAALRDASSRGATTIALTNVVGSSAARESDHAMFIRSGPEIGVAATKTFTAQLLSVTLLSRALLDSRRGDHDLVAACRRLPADVQQVLDSAELEPIIDAFAHSRAYLFMGRGVHLPIALEGALKVKEITYTHAEGFGAGELKHGPLALVDENTPVFAVITGDGKPANKTLTNIKEVEARSAPVIAVTDGVLEVERYVDHVLEVPRTRPALAGVLATVHFQLFAYGLANRLGREIDTPRNLAKSVTVE